MKKICEICRCAVEPPDLAFRMKIELYADPDPPEIRFEDLFVDCKAEMERLIEAMEKADPREAEEEVHESYVFTLCGACRDRLHRGLRAHNQPFEDFSGPAE